MDAIYAHYGDVNETADRIKGRFARRPMGAVHLRNVSGKVEIFALEQGLPF